MADSTHVGFKADMMRLVCVSDTHNRHNQFTVPDGDALLHAGDLTMQGTLPEIEAAFTWLSRLPHERIIVTPGNHDFAFEAGTPLTRQLRAKFRRVEILIDEAAVLGQFTVWGSPWQPWFHDWAFNLPRDSDAIAAKWLLIPPDTGILLTHGPPAGVRDQTVLGEHVGCERLAQRISQLRNLRLAVFGHIHESYGRIDLNGTTYVNASICDARYRPIHAPLVVDLS